MEPQNWHSDFNPQKFLSRIDIESLIEKNEVRPENQIDKGNTPCIICESKQVPGLLLNDKSFLCKQCFSDVSTISYPSKYELAYRDHLSALESRRIALEEFSIKYGYTKYDSILHTIGWGSIILLFINIALIVVPITLLITAYINDSIQDSKYNKWLELKTEWERKYPEPNKPVLRHFHDPLAKLSTTDYKILKIFNNWPGYPPFWHYLREVVLKRNNNHCQVTGCPSRASLHIHHKNSISNGGTHTPDNLITLCEFHHGLEPEAGHERVWGAITYRHFTMVRAHLRRNKTTSGYHEVRAHIRRLELVNEQELIEIFNYHEMSCPNCDSNDIHISVNNEVEILCISCDQIWIGEKELTEETGPRIAELLKINKNLGSWKVRWDMLSTRKDKVFSALNSGQKRKLKKAKKKAIEKSRCPKCGGNMRLIKPRRGQEWKKFWGCTNWRITGCKGTRRA